MKAGHGNRYQYLHGAGNEESKRYHIEDGALMLTLAEGVERSRKAVGIYVNPGNTSFREAVNSMIYVDKSGLLSYMNSVLNTKQKNLCVSRPRRFGKSMAADMLAAYYSKGCDSYNLFAGRKIEESSFETHLNSHSVIRLDVQRFVEKKSDLDTFIAEIEARVIAELREEFPGCVDAVPDIRLKVALDQIFNRTVRGFYSLLTSGTVCFGWRKSAGKTRKSIWIF